MPSYYHQPSSLSRLHILKSSRDNDNNNVQKKEEEWRAFRARLVQHGLPSLDDNSKLNNDDHDTSKSCNDDTQQYAHITTPLVEIGSILLSIPTRDICQGLEQQYWHRSVVLITNVTSNVVNGEPIDTLEVPEDQLANGDKYGRWSYRGLLLNRLTDLLYVDSNNNDDVYDKGWQVHRGGDLLGLDSSDGNTDFTCLYMSSNSTSSINKGGVDATRLVGNLSYMKLEDAQSLCKNDPSSYNSNDFYTFAGFCSWRPAQLEREMGDERNEWVVLSVDEQTIWNELKLQSSPQSTMPQQQEQQDDESNDSLLEAGTNMWRNYLDKVDISESKATERLPAGQLLFYDEMLKVWAEDNLNVNLKDSKKQQLDQPKKSQQIARGRLNLVL